MVIGIAPRLALAVCLSGSSGTGGFEASAFASFSPRVTKTLSPNIPDVDLPAYSNALLASRRAAWRAFSAASTRARVLGGFGGERHADDFDNAVGRALCRVL